jgi:hypothetical protein
VTSAGAGDGTTYADRAALFDSGNWSSVITEFDFTADSLVARIGPGTYTCAQTLMSTLFTTVPNVVGPLVLHGCDSFGNLLSPSNPGWISAQPVDWESNLPVIATTTNIATINLPNTFLRLLKFTATETTTVQPLTAFVGADWFIVELSASNTAAIAVASGSLFRTSNFCVRMLGSSFSTALNYTGGALDNFRVEAAATSGNRRGLSMNATNAFFCTRGCIIGCAEGVRSVSTSTSGQVHISKFTVVNCGAAITGHSTANQLSTYTIRNCYVANNTGFGINTNGSRVIIANNRLRNNSDGNFNTFGNYPTDMDSFTDAGTDAAEFVNAAAGDYRIKYGSEYWGLGIGAGDEPAPAGGLGFNRSMLGGFDE